MITVIFLLLQIPAGFEAKQAQIADFADCVTAQEPQRVTNFLATIPASKEEKSGIRKFASFSNCTRGRPFVSSRTGELRGAMAEILLRKDPARIERLNTSVAIAPVRITEKVVGTRTFVIAYSQCIAAAAPKQAVTLLTTAYDSKEEQSAFLAIGDPLTTCLPKGIAYRINIRDVRNHVADVLYRMSGVPRA